MHGCFKAWGKVSGWPWQGLWSPEGHSLQSASWAPSSPKGKLQGLQEKA